MSEKKLKEEDYEKYFMSDNKSMVIIKQKRCQDIEIDESEIGIVRLWHGAVGDRSDLIRVEHSSIDDLIKCLTKLKEGK